MSEKQEITIHNMYDHVIYDYDINNKILGIFWDNNNIELNKLMNDEMNCYNYKHDNTKKYSCLWIDKLKECINYQDGDKIPFQVKFHNNYFHICINCHIDRKFIMEEISNDGCLYICPYGDVLSYLQGPSVTHDIYPSLNKCNCLYNDFMDENDKPYILK